MPREIFAQEAALVEKSAPPIENDSLKDEQDSHAEPDKSTKSQPMHPEESPVILKESEEKSSQEGIGDVFSKDQGDRFQSKDNKKVEFTTVK